jgi:hypothetical protein
MVKPKKPKKFKLIDDVKDIDKRQDNSDTKSDDKSLWKYISGVLMKVYARPFSEKDWISSRSRNLGGGRGGGGLYMTQA